jgi:hypothetical protein
VISAIAKIAWPVAIVALLFHYRDTVQRLLGGREVGKVQVGPVSAEFVAATRSVEAAASRAGIDEPDTTDLGIEHNLVEELARADPHAAVTTSWARVRQASSIAVARLTNEPLKPSTVGKLEQLQAHGLLEPQVVDLGRTLKDMEKTILPRQQRDIPIDFARAFSLAAISLAKRIGDLMPEGYEGSFPSYPSYGQYGGSGSSYGQSYSPYQGPTPPSYGPGGTGGPDTQAGDGQSG